MKTLKITFHIAFGLLAGCACASLVPACAPPPKAPYHCGDLTDLQEAYRQALIEACGTRKVADCPAAEAIGNAFEDAVVERCEAPARQAGVE